MTDYDDLLERIEALAEEWDRKAQYLMNYPGAGEAAVTSKAAGRSYAKAVKQLRNLLLSPGERGAEPGLRLPDPKSGCACTPFSQSAEWILRPAPTPPVREAAATAEHICVYGCLPDAHIATDWAAHPTPVAPEAGDVEAAIAPLVAEFAEEMNYPQAALSQFAHIVWTSDWLAARDARMLAEGAEKALRKAAGDLLLACSHFDRYRNQPEWCGYCESAVDSMLGGMPNYKELARAAALRSGGAR